jgi:hypothetical protein
MIGVETVKLDYKHDKGQMKIFFWYMCCIWRFDGQKSSGTSDYVKYKFDVVHIGGLMNRKHWVPVIMSNISLMLYILEV